MGDFEFLWYGFQCDAGVRKITQTVFFDDIAITPVALWQLAKDPVNEKHRACKHRSLNTRE